MNIIKNLYVEFERSAMEWDPIGKTLSVAVSRLDIPIRTLAKKVHIRRGGSVLIFEHYNTMYDQAGPISWSYRLVSGGRFFCRLEVLNDTDSINN